MPAAEIGTGHLLSGFFASIRQPRRKCRVSPCVFRAFYKVPSSAVLRRQARQILSASISRTHRAPKPRPWRWLLIELRVKLAPVLGNRPKGICRDAPSHRLVITSMATLLWPPSTIMVMIK
jgi:hypothetical protein